MSTILFKDGKQSKFEANRVKGALEAGWSVDPAEKAKAVKTVKAAFAAKPAEDDEAVRELAKEAGIGNYWNKTISNLKEELGV
jgi:hypothetical protein